MYAMHGVVERPVADLVQHRNMLDRNAFARFVAGRAPRFGSLEQAVLGAANALTIDDATTAAFDAALLAREAGHETTVFINPFNVETGAPYWFSVLDVALDRTSRPSYRFDGRDFALTVPASKRQLRAVVAARIRALSSEEMRTAAVAEVADALGERDPEVPLALTPMSRTAVQRLREAGVRIENHGWTHRHPASGPPETLWSDIARGQSWLREHLGIESRVYAVPFGEAAPPSGMPDDLIDMWYLASSGSPGKTGDRAFNRSPLEPRDIVT